MLFTERESYESAEFNLQQQQQEREDDDGIAQFQKNINQKPEIIRNRVLEITDPCLEPKRTGRCKAHIPKYYFNTKIGQCERFIFGGCDATGNNFENLLECEERCKAHLRKAATSETEDESANNDDGTNKRL